MSIQFINFGGGGGGAFIPLSGTVSGSPVTGNIQFDDLSSIGQSEILKYQTGGAGSKVSLQLNTNAQLATDDNAGRTSFIYAGLVNNAMQTFVSGGETLLLRQDVANGHRINYDGNPAKSVLSVFNGGTNPALNAVLNIGSGNTNIGQIYLEPGTLKTTPVNNVIEATTQGTFLTTLGNRGVILHNDYEFSQAGRSGQIEFDATRVYMNYRDASFDDINSQFSMSNTGFLFQSAETLTFNITGRMSIDPISNLLEMSMDDGTNNNRFRITSTTMSFFSATPVSQQVITATAAGATYGANEQTLLNEIRTLLLNYGLAA